MNALLLRVGCKNRSERRSWIWQARLGLSEQRNAQGLAMQGKTPGRAFCGVTRAYSAELTNAWRALTRSTGSIPDQSSPASCAGGRATGASFC